MSNMRVILLQRVVTRIFSHYWWNILELLLHHTQIFFKNPTIDNINILHIACRHARFEMCVKLADTFPNLINEITEKGWNAALFITEKAGAERERIDISWKSVNWMFTMFLGQEKLYCIMHVQTDQENLWNIY